MFLKTKYEENVDQDVTFQFKITLCVKYVCNCQKMTWKLSHLNQLKILYFYTDLVFANEALGGIDVLI